MSKQLEKTIEKGWERRESVGPDTGGELREAVEAALTMLDNGEARVATKAGSEGWVVHQWLKKAVLLSFRLNPMTAIAGGPGGASWWP